MLDREYTIKPFAWLKQPWAFPVVLVALFIGFLLVMRVPWGKPTVADWVQVIGTLLAIIGAATFPYMHERARSKEKAESLRKVLLVLAWQQRIEIDQLARTLEKAINDFGDPSINDYIEDGWHLNWAPMIENLRAIPIAELHPRQVHWLGEMKVAAEFAAGVAARLDTWDVIGDRELNDIRLLERYLTNGEDITEDLQMGDFS